jgi:plastocyanin
MLTIAVGVVVFAVSVQPAHAQGSETGRIEGVATLSSRLTTSRLRLRVYDEPGAAAPIAAAETSPLANVVMYLESTGTLRAVGNRPDAGARALHQKDERFAPHVVAVMAGSVVQFPNDDPIFHNVFSLSSIATFDLGRYPAGTSKSVTFARPGVAQIFCHIHADMSAFVVVLDHPFFVVPDANGHFVLEGVPPGDYKLMAWHERIRPFATPVHVDANRTTSTNIRIPLPDSGK